MLLSHVWYLVLVCLLTCLPWLSDPLKITKVDFSSNVHNRVRTYFERREHTTFFFICSFYPRCAVCFLVACCFIASLWEFAFVSTFKWQAVPRLQHTDLPSESPVVSPYNLFEVTLVCFTLLINDICNSE